MWRVIRWLIPLALITFGLLWPLVFRGGSEAKDVSDPVVFSNYKGDFVVNSDGRLDAVETITAEFPSGRHGIFRYWDVANQNSPRVPPAWARRRRRRRCSSGMSSPRHGTTG
jgi:hypothetical protein